jgi:hypothetical protein
MGKIIRMGPQVESQHTEQNTQGPSLYKTLSDITSNNTKEIQDVLPQGLRNISQFGQGVAEGGAAILGLPGTAYNLVRSGTGGVASLLGQENPLPENKYVPTSGDLIEGVQNIAKSVLPESHLKPKGFKEKVIKESGSLLPTTIGTIALGGIPLAAIGRNVASSVGAVLGEDAAGDFGKVVGGLVGNYGFNKFYNWFNKNILKGADPKTLDSIAKETQQQLYERERQLGKGVIENVPTYQQDLLSLEKELEGSLAFKDAAQQKDLINRVKTYLSEANDGNVDISKLIERKKEINGILAQTQGPQYKQYRTFLERIQKAMFDAADRIGITNPEWEKSWRAADNITKALNYGKHLTETLEKAPSLMAKLTSPLATLAIGASGGGAFGGPLGGIIGGAVAGGVSLVGHGLKYAAKQGLTKAKQLYGFMKTPETRALLGKAFSYTLEDNIPSLANTYTQINKRAKSYAKKHPVKEETAKKKSSGSIVRMGSTP